MKKILLVLALMGLSYQVHAVGAPSATQSSNPSPVAIANDANSRVMITKDKDGEHDVFNRWGQEKLARVENSSIAVLFSSASLGLVDGVCLSSGVASSTSNIGDFLVIADSNTAFGWSTVNLGTAPIGVFGTLDILQSPGVSANGSLGNAGCHQYDPPLPFVNGLVAFPSSAATKSYIRYRVLRQ